MLAFTTFLAFVTAAAAAPLDLPIPIPTLLPSVPIASVNPLPSLQPLPLIPSIINTTSLSPPVYPQPEPLYGNTTGVHDPAIVKSADGTYFVFGSGGWTSDEGVSVGLAIPTWSSRDRITWNYLGTVFPRGGHDDNYEGPADTYAYTNSTQAALWAPDVTLIDGVLWMYYSASFAGQMKSAVLLARSTTGLPGSWSDDGVIVATAKGCNWNAIDPNLLITPDGRWFLSLGSYFTGKFSCIKMVPLEVGTGRLLDGPEVTVDPLTGLLNGKQVTSLAARVHQIQGLEGSFIHWNSPYYYLYTSWGVCCSGTTPSYNVRVVRSPSPEGPYFDQGGASALAGNGTEFLTHHDGIWGPGGQSLLQDGPELVMVYHYLKDNTTVPNMGINQIVYNPITGWPVLV